MQLEGNGCARLCAGAGCCRDLDLCTCSRRGGSFHGACCHLLLDAISLAVPDNCSRWGGAPWRSRAPMEARGDLEVFWFTGFCRSWLGESPLDLAG